MPLLEIVRDEHTDPEMLARGLAFARHIDKLPLPVSATPGFLVNRVLMPYLLEAVRLLDEGVPASVIDHAALDFGMPMGPIELADTVGLDICLSVARKLAPLHDEPLPGQLEQQVEAGHLGKKSGQGFYRWQKGQAQKPKVNMPPRTRLEELADRMILRLINESVAYLREGVVEDADLLDAGVIFGTGFAPFRGGPCNMPASAGWNAARSGYTNSKPIMATSSTPIPVGTSWRPGMDEATGTGEHPDRVEPAMNYDKAKAS